MAAAGMKDKMYQILLKTVHFCFLQMKPRNFTAHVAQEMLTWSVTSLVPTQLSQKHTDNCDEGAQPDCAVGLLSPLSPCLAAALERATLLSVPAACHTVHSRSWMLLCLE